MMDRVTLIILLTIALTVNVTGFPSHESDDCIDGPRNTTTHYRVSGYKIFCMGSKDRVISYQMQEGCFKDASCDYFMSAKVITNPQHGNGQEHFHWNLYSKKGEMLFILNKESIPIDRNLDIRGVTVLSTLKYPAPEFVYWKDTSGGNDSTSWKHLESRRISTFEEDTDGGDKPYELQASLLVGPNPSFPSKTVKYNRVSVTTWNLGSDTEDTWVSNPLLYPVVPYLIGVDNLPGIDVPVVTVLSPRVPLYLFNDSVNNNDAKTADYFYLGGRDFTPVPSTLESQSTETHEPTPEPASKSSDSYWFVWVVIAMFVILVAVGVVIFVLRKKKKVQTVVNGFSPAANSPEKERSLKP